VSAGKPASNTNLVQIEPDLLGERDQRRPPARRLPFQDQISSPLCDGGVVHSADSNCAAVARLALAEEFTGTFQPRHIRNATPHATVRSSVKRVVLLHRRS
jgi:hypothetical protein